MRLIDRLGERYRQFTGGYWEGMASGAAVLMPLGSVDGRREAPIPNLIAESQEAYATSGIVFALVLARSMMFSQGKLCFRDLEDKTIKDLPPRAGILEDPWPDGTDRDLRMRMMQDLDVSGNFFGWKVAPDRIYRIPPAEMTIVSTLVTTPTGAEYKDVIGYDWDPQKNLPNAKPDINAHFFTPEEVVHWAPIKDPIAQTRGMSWLTPILRDVRADTGITHYKNEWLDHGQPVVAVKYPQRLRNDTTDYITERIMAKYGGLSNSFKPLIFDQGADPIIGASLKDLDLTAIQSGGEERICSAAGVPPEIIGLRDMAAEQYAPAIRKFVDLTIWPLWISGCAALERFINVPDGQELWIDTSDITAIQDVAKEKAQVMQINAAASLTLIQAGFTRKSVLEALVAADMSLLVPDPNAPIPGVQERETVNVADMGPPVTGPGSGTNSDTQNALGKTGNPPGGGQVLTQPQTPASKTPMPNTFPASAGASNGQAARPSANRG